MPWKILKQRDATNETESNKLETEMEGTTLGYGLWTTKEDHKPQLEFKPPKGN